MTEKRKQQLAELQALPLPYQFFIKDEQAHLRVCLCRECILELKHEYNPWIDDKGKKIPLENIETFEVPITQCYNYLATQDKLTPKKKK